MKPEISVILPFYNAENTLRCAVESILSQTFKNFELLLIDNSSTDSSLRIAKDLANSDSRINLYTEKKQGVVHAMNLGLCNSSGTYIARMDSDDISYSTRLEKQLNFMKNDPALDFIGCEVKYVAHNENTAGFKRFVNWVNSFHSPKQIEDMRFIEIPVINPTIFFKRELFGKYGGCYDGDFPEDYEMQLRFLEKGVKMAKIPEQLLEWHDYSTRLTRTDDRYSSNAFFKTKATYLKGWSKKHNPFHPDIWIWGAGRKSRKRAGFIEETGLNIKGLIDIVPNKPNTMHYSEIPLPGKIFIVSMVTNAGAGDKIRNYLQDKTYSEGKHFLLMG